MNDKDASKPQFAGGAGDSFETAVIVQGVSDESAGVAAEYLYLSRTLGQPGADWRMVKQSLLAHEGRSYDRMDVLLTDGTTRSIYFDISAFFGR